MAKQQKQPVNVYGKTVPTSLTGLNDEYMIAFLTDKLKNGAITKEQIAEYKEASAGMKSNDKRREFAKRFMPELIKKKSFDERLGDLLK